MHLISGAGVLRAASTVQHVYGALECNTPAALQQGSSQNISRFPNLSTSSQPAGNLEGARWQTRRLPSAFVSEFFCAIGSSLRRFPDICRGEDSVSKGRQPPHGWTHAVFFRRFIVFYPVVPHSQSPKSPLSIREEDWLQIESGVVQRVGHGGVRVWIAGRPSMSFFAMETPLRPFVPRVYLLGYSPVFLAGGSSIAIAVYPEEVKSLPPRAVS
ncbi:hypothetical protein FB451DRAFT_1468031 [Mycena latifolia]|nr:hypothetical protein FB451DRAFT_1468031 [Mycena latifolia]